MRVAFFGGSFDPPHCGHLAIAQAAASRLQLDAVLFAPVGVQPHKVNGPAPTSFADRVEMVRLAIAGHPLFELSLIDAPRDDKQPNYTLDALARLRTTLRAGDKLFCLLGADSFLALPKWYRADELLFACDVIVAGRPGFLLDQLAPALPPGVEVVRATQRHTADCVVFTLERPNLAGHSQLYLLPDLREDISATRIRAALAEGQGSDGEGNDGDESVLPAAVVAFIRAHRLYR